MSFPIINYNFNNHTEAQALTGVTDQKLSSLEKFFKSNASVACDVTFSKVAANKNGQVHQIEVNLEVDGTLYRAEATEDSFERAIDEVKDELDKELRRAKDKQVSLDKQAGREAKEQMLNGG